MSSESDAWEDAPVVRALEPFGVFYRRAYRPMVGLALVLSGRPDFAEDIAQEALLAAFRSWDRVGRLDDPAGWVRRVVANRSVSLFRRSISELKALNRLGRPNEVAVERDLAEAMALWTTVRRRLPKRQAVAIALRYVEGLGLADIADIMNCSVSTASTHLRRGHERLATELGADWREDW